LKLGTFFRSFTMAHMSDYLESGLLHHVFRGQSFPKPTGMAIALTSGVPAESGDAKNQYKGGWFQELPSGDDLLGDTGYRRVELGPPEDNGDTFWDFEEVDFEAGSGVIKNCDAIYFGTALTEWGWVSGIAFCERHQFGEGALIMQAQLDNPRYVFKGDSLKFDAQKLRIQFK